MRPDRSARPEFVEAFATIAARIGKSLEGVPKRLLPIRMYVAGGAALHLYTGARTSEDVDASFSRRIALPENLEVAYRDADGRARVLYFDRNYNDTFALMHEDAWDDSRLLEIDGVDRNRLEVRLLSPLDLAVSKLARFSSQDRDDIITLARHRLIDGASLRKRAEEALGGYVGDVARLQGTIEIARRIIADARSR